MNPLATFAHFFKTGGPFMYAVFFAALAIIALIAERFWVIARAGNINTEKLTNDVLSRIAKGDIPSATDLCRKVRGPAAAVAHAILLRNTSDEDKMRNAADGAASVVLPPLSRRLSYLTMLANTERGRVVTHSQAVGWQHAAGFEHVRLLEPIGFNFVYFANRPPERA